MTDGKRKIITVWNLAPVAVILGWMTFRWIRAGGWRNDFIEDIAYGGFGLVLIWCCNGFRRDEFTSWARPMPVRVKSSPPMLIALMGWFFVIGMPAILFLIREAVGV